MKKLFCLVSFGLSCVCSGLSLNGATISPAKRVSWSLPTGLAESVSFSDMADGYSRIEAESLEASQGEYGAPALPSKTLLFAVPEGYAVDAVSVNVAWKTLKSGITVYPIQAPTRISEEPVFTPPVAEYYSMDVYPAQTYAQLPIATASGVDMVSVAVTPFRYLAKDKVLEVAESLTVVVTFKSASGVSTKSATLKPRYAAKLRAQVQGMVENPADVSVDAGLSAKAANNQPDYIVISPSTLVSAWETYVAARRVTHPELIFAVKNADEIYRDYTNLYNVTPVTACRNRQEKLWSYIRDMASKGTMYFVMGGPFLVDKDSVAVYDGNGVRLTTDNALPGAYGTPNGDDTPTDYFYACLDIKEGVAHPYPWDSDGNGVYCNGSETTSTIDMIADVVVARMPMTAFDYGTGSGVMSAPDLIAAYTQKLARGEPMDYAGRFKYGLTGQSLNGQSYVSGSNGLTIRRELDFYDDAYNMFDTRHPSRFVDTEVAQRNRSRNFVTQFRPVRQNVTMLETVSSKYYNNSNAARGIFLAGEYEFGMTAGHGSVHYVDGFESSAVRKNRGLVKIFDAALPCHTGSMDNRWGTRVDPCLGESYVNNPVGGALVSFNNSRSGFYDTSTGDGNMSPALTAWLADFLFRENQTAGFAWKSALSKRAAYMTGLGNRNTDCIIEIVHFGDPLVRITPMANMTWLGTAGNHEWSTSVANWRSSTNATATVKYEHASHTYIPASENQTMQLNELVSTLTMGVNQPAGSTFSVSGSGSLKVMNGLVITNGNLSLNVPGGVGVNGVTFVNEKGVLTFGSTAVTNTYVAKVVNASEVRMQGANAILDVAEGAPLGTDRIIVTGTSAATCTNNIIRTRSDGMLATYPTIPVNNATLKLETVNAGSDTASTSPLCVVTNGTLEIGTNPMWSWERLTRPVVLHNGTIAGTGKFVGFGNTKSGGFDVTATGDSTITGTRAIELMGETRIRMSNALDTVTLSGTFTENSTRAGSIRKMGEGRLVIADDTSAAGTLIVEQGTLVLQQIPLVNVTNLIVKSGVKVILPHTTTRQYQVLVPGGTVATFEAGSQIYDANDVDTPLTGSLSRLSMYFAETGLRTWKGDASGAGVWNTTASNKPWWNVAGQISAAFVTGGTVTFADLSGAANAVIAVEGLQAATFATYANTNTTYTFNPQTAESQLSFAILTTTGPTTFNLPVKVTSDIVVDSDVLQMKKVEARWIDVKDGATFGATCVTNSLYKVIKAVRLAPLAIEGTGNQGPALAELVLFRNGTVVPWTDTTIVSSKPSNGSHGVECLIDGILGATNNNKWWLNGANGSSSAELAQTNCYATITFATPIDMFDGYSLQAPDVTAGAEGRGVTAWVLQVSYDGTTFVTIDAQSGFVPDTNYKWYRGSATTPGFMIPNTSAVLPTVTVFDGGRLLAQGSHFATIDLQDGAILKGVDGQALRMCKPEELHYTTNGVGVIGVDASGMTLSSTPVVILAGQNFSAYDVYLFTSLTPDAVLSIVEGDLCVSQSSGLVAPYTRLISGDTTWNRADWFATNNVPFGNTWSSLILNSEGLINLIVTNTSSAVTMSVDTPVQVGKVAFYGKQKLTLALTGDNVIEAQSYDFRNMDADVDLAFNTRDAIIYVGTNTTEVLGGNGSLVFENAGTAVLNAPWTGSVTFGTGANELVYRGTQPGKPFNQKNATIETTMALGDFTWSGDWLRIGSGATVTAGTLSKVAANRNLSVDGGSLTVNAYVGPNDDTSNDIEVINGGQFVCTTTFLSSRRIGGVAPPIRVSGNGSLLKVGTLQNDNYWNPANRQPIYIEQGGTLSIGSGGIKRIYNDYYDVGYYLDMDQGALMAHGNWTITDANGKKTLATIRIARGSFATINPQEYTITYTRSIEDAPGTEGGGGTLVVGGAESAIGKVVLATANLYTGGTVITNTTLEITNVGALGISGPLTMQQGSVLNLSTYRPENIVLQANPKGTLKVKIADTAASEKLLAVTDDFTYPSAGFTVEAVDANGSAVDASKIKMGAGYLMYVPGGQTILPYVVNVSGNTSWSSATWTDAVGTPVSATIWNQAQGEVMIRATGTGTLTLDRSVTVTNVLFRGVGAVTLTAGTNGTFVDLAKLDASVATGLVTLNLNPGTATIVAGVDTVVKQAGVGTLSVASGMQATLEGIAWDTTKIINNGTVRVKGGTADSPITLASTGANTTLGNYTVAENSFFKQAATGGNKRYTVTGVDSSSTLIMESGQNWGMTDGTQIRNVTAELSTSYEFWIEPETAFDSSVDLVLSTKTVHVGHGNNGWKNYTIGSLSGSGNIVNNVANPVITINMLRGPTTYSGASASAFVVGGTHPLTLSGASSGALTIKPDATVILANGGTTSGAIVNNGTLQFPVGTDATRTFSRGVSGTGRLLKTGTGTLELTAENTYTGGTSVDAGTLKLGASGTLGTGAVTFANGTTLDLSAKTSTLESEVVIPESATVNLVLGSRAFASATLISWSTPPVGAFTCLDLPVNATLEKTDTGLVLTATVITIPDAVGAHLSTGYWTEQLWNVPEALSAQLWSVATSMAVAVTNNTADATVTLDANTSIRSLAVVNTFPTTLTCNPGVTFSATSYDFTGALAKTTLGFSTAGVAVTAGADTVFTQAGTGALTIPAGKKATINAPWTGTVSQTGTLAYGGTHNYTTAFNLKDGVVTEIAGDVTVNPSNGGRENRFGMNNSTLNIKSGTLKPKAFLTNNTAASTTATINQTGGTVDMTGYGTEPGTGDNRYPYDNPVGNPCFGHWTGSTIYNLSGGTFNAANRYVELGFTANVTLNQSGNSIFKVKSIVATDGRGTYNLTGGTLELKERIDLPGGTARINLGAGTIKATGAFRFAQQANLTGAAGTTIDVDTFDVTLSTVIAGSGKLVVNDSSAGNGSLTLGGVNTYTGGTTVNAGTLKITNGAGLGTGAATVATGATLDIGSTRPTNIFTFEADSTLKVMGNAWKDFGTITLRVASATVPNIELVNSAGMAITPTSKTVTGNVLTIIYPFTVQPEDVKGVNCWYDWEFNETVSNTTPPNTGRATGSFNGSDNTYTYVASGSSTNMYAAARPWLDLAYPALWTFTMAVKMPAVENTVLVSFGTMTAGQIALIKGAGDAEVKLVRTDPATAIENYQHYMALATMTVPHASTARHLYTFVKRDATTLEIYLDSTKWLTYTGDITIGNGFQMGSIHGGLGASSGMKQIVGTDTVATMDMLRIFDVALPESAIGILANEFPYTSPAGSFSREIATATADYKTAVNTWTKQGDGVANYAEPDNGGAITMTATADATVTMNLDSAKSAEGLTLDGAGAFTFTKGTGLLTVVGMSQVSANTTVDVDAVRMTGPVRIADGKTLTINAAGIDLSAVTERSIIVPVTGLVTLGTGATLTIDTTTAPEGWTVSKTGSNEAGWTLTYTVATDNLTWRGPDGEQSMGFTAGVWTTDATQTPWKLQDLPSSTLLYAFADGKNVFFGDYSYLSISNNTDTACSVAGVAVSGSVVPASMTFSNTATYYMFVPASTNGTDLIQVTGDISIGAKGAYFEVPVKMTGNLNLNGETFIAAAFGADVTATSTAGIYNGVISGTGTLAIADTTLTLSGINTATGGYAIGTGATVKMGNARCFGANGSTANTALVTILGGGTVDYNGQANHVNKFTLAGGSLVNNGGEIGVGAQQMSELTVTADSTIGGSANFGFINSQYAATTLTLNGKTLTKTGANTFWVCNTTADAGTIAVTEGGLSLIAYGAGTGSFMPETTMTFATGTTLNLARPLTIGTLTFNGTLTGTSALTINHGITASATTFPNLTLNSGVTVDCTAADSVLKATTLTVASGASIAVDVTGRTLAPTNTLITWTGTSPVGGFTLTGAPVGATCEKRETSLVLILPTGPIVDPTAGDTLDQAEKDAVAEAATEAGITSGTIIVSQETATKIMLLDVTPTFTPAGSDTNIVDEIDVAFAVTDITFDPTTGLPTVSATIKDDTGTTPVSTTTAAQVVVYGKATLTDAWEPIGAPDTEPKSTFRATTATYKFFKFVVERKAP